MTVPMAAILPLLPAPPPAPTPGAPGPFAFADRDRPFAILRDAGFADISIEPLDAQVAWGDLDTATRLAMRLGPVGGMVRENPQLAETMAGAIRVALEAYAGDNGVRLDSASWIVLAK
jgi:hypothetical protein